MMTAKDYRAIATAIRNAQPLFPENLSDTDFEQGNRFGRVNAVADVVDELVEVFSADNPRFDAALFEKACGF